MYIRPHGGGCCGMTHIYSLGVDPKFVLGAVTKPSVIPQNNQNVLYSRPKESNEERLRWIISTIGTRCQQVGNPRLPCNCEDLTIARPGGIIEVVLTQHQVILWRPVLEDIGFKEVNSAVNSNSNNTIHVFHLNTGQED